MEALLEGEKRGAAHIMVELPPRRGVIVMPRTAATVLETVTLLGALALQAGQVM
jgi:hypothetical protein